MGQIHDVTERYKQINFLVSFKVGRGKERARAGGGWLEQPGNLVRFVSFFLEGLQPRQPHRVTSGLLQLHMHIT